MTANQYKALTNPGKNSIIHELVIARWNVPQGKVFPGWKPRPGGFGLLRDIQGSTPEDTIALVKAHDQRFMKLFGYPNCEAAAAAADAEAARQSYHDYIHGTMYCEGAVFMGSELLR